jgi:3-methyladenine DNA glycosylase/8-oxoguanine DNA glycosylase
MGRRSQVVRQRSAKPLSAGSIPAVASNFLIPTPPGFSFEATVESHGWYQLAPFRWDGKVLRRAEQLPGGGVVDMSFRDAKKGIRVDVRPPGAGEDTRAPMSRMFQLHVDTTEFVALTKESPNHAWVAEAGFGRLLCGTTLFEDIVKIITTTNTTWAQTKRMVELLVQKCGPVSPEGFHAFPRPQDIARFTVDELQRDCRLGYRAKTIHALATGVASGSIDLTAISDPAQTTDGLFASYKTLPGIGPYGAAHLLAMDGRHDFIAVDTEFRRFVRDTYHKGRRVSDLTMLRRYSKWGRWKYLAYWAELWNSVAGRLQPERDEDQ